MFAIGDSYYRRSLLQAFTAADTVRHNVREVSFRIDLGEEHDVITNEAERQRLAS